MRKNTPPATIWMDIKKRIEFAIMDGTFKNASKIPSIAELAEEYCCAKSTAHKVLEEMYHEGIVTKQKGVGYFVKPYVKEKLLDKYMNELETELARNIKEAQLLGIGINTLEKLIIDKITSVYSQ